jgi:hypothetical protein
MKRLSSNRRDTINVEDIDLEAGPGGGKPPEGGTKTEAERIAAEEAANRKTPEQLEEERLAAEEEANKNTFSELVKDVENETIKALNLEQGNALLETHKGVGFDKDGNIINVQGEVVKNFDDFKDEIKEASTEDPLKDAGEVEIEGTTYKLDENKNAVDADGKVVKTKEEILEMLNEGEEGDDDNYVSQVSSITGFQAVDDKGNEITFENTVQGLADRETHIVNQEARKLASQELDTFFDKNPDIIEMYNYKKLHGNLDGFADAKDYSKITLEDSNDDQHRQIIIEAEQAQGKDEKRAKQYADMMISDGKGKDEAEASLNFLKDKQTKDAQAIVDARTEKEGVAKETYKKYVTEVAEVVKSGTANGFKIPDHFEATLADGSKRVVKRDAIFHLVTEPVGDDGETVYDKMLARDSVEAKVLDAYMRLIGYDFNKLATQKANSQKIVNLKEAKKKAGNKVNIIKKDLTGPVAAEDIA